MFKIMVHPGRRQLPDLRLDDGRRPANDGASAIALAAGAMGASPRTCAASDGTRTRLASAHGTRARGNADPRLGKERRHDARKRRRAGVTGREGGPAYGRSSREWTATRFRLPCHEHSD